MKVKEVMATNPRICAPETTAAEAAHLMWDADCGFLPVVEHGAIVGVVTDRDLYIALATRNCLASDLTVGEVSTGDLFTCAPEDDLHAVLQIMKRNRIRRLPVTVLGGQVTGIISLDDIIAVAGSEQGVHPDEVVAALQAITLHHHQPVTIS